MIKIVFFGLGSIGKKHIKILSKMSNVDLFAYRSTKKKELNNSLKIKEIFSWKEVENIGPDIAFITNPTFMHINIAIKCAKLGIKLFIEKPIDCTNKDLDTLVDIVKTKKIVTYIGYNFRFHPIIKFLKKYLLNKKIYHVSIYNSSYLPNWRNGIDYKKSYSCFKEKGGGVILDLSHEFDYIHYLFGKIENIKGFSNKISDLVVNSEDFLDAVIKINKIYINLHLSFLSLNKERSIKIDCEKEYIYANLVEDFIQISNNKGNIKKTYNLGLEQSYIDQIKYFLKNIDNYQMMNNIIEASFLFKKILNFKEKLSENTSCSSC